MPFLFAIAGTFLFVLLVHLYRRTSGPLSQFSVNEEGKLYNRILDPEEGQYH